MKRKKPGATKGKNKKTPDSNLMILAVPLRQFGGAADVDVARVRRPHRSEGSPKIVKAEKEPKGNRTRAS